MSGELSAEEIAGFKQKVTDLLSNAFTPEGFAIIDVNFVVVPPADRDLLWFATDFDHRLALASDAGEQLAKS
jgi:hypothetical protein